MNEVLIDNAVALPNKMPLLKNFVYQRVDINA